MNHIVRSVYILFAWVVAPAVILRGESARADEGTTIHFDSSGIHVYSPTLMDAYSQGMGYLQAPPGNAYAANPDLLMALELVQAALRNLEDVLAYRRQNMSWYDIMNTLNVNPAYFDPPVDVRTYGPPYSVAYDCSLSGGCPDRRWSDEDLRRLAAVKVFSERTHRPYPEVIRVYRSHPKVIFHDRVYVVRHVPLGQAKKLAAGHYAPASGQKKYSHGPSVHGNPHSNGNTPQGGSKHGGGEKGHGKSHGQKKGHGHGH